MPEGTLGTRLLSLHERYSIARYNLGFSHPITVLVTYPTVSAAPNEPHFTSRIRLLLERFPLLSAKLVDRNTTKPHHQENRDSIDPADVIRYDTYAPVSDASAEREGVLRYELERAVEVDIDLHPQWSVSVYTATSGEEKKQAYVAITANHVLLDGKGIFNLTAALLSSNAPDLPQEQVGTVTRLDDTHNLKPGLWLMLVTVWTALIVPKLPGFIQSYLRPVPSWPAHLVAKPPTECSPRMTVLELPASLISSLKEAGKANGVTTLHPILKLSYGTAVWARFGQTLSPFHIQLGTPGNSRDLAKGHGYCTGNYTTHIDVDLHPTPSISFWTETAKAAKYMRSDAGKAHSLQSLGMLAYIPDAEKSAEERKGSKPTGWEDFLYGQATGTMPHSQGVNMSNIGLVPLPEEATDLIWSQAVSPFSPPFSMTVVGHEAGLRVTTLWREGSTVTEEDVKAVQAIWVKILERLADPKWKGTTLGELIAGASAERVF